MAEGVPTNVHYAPVQQVQQVPAQQVIVVPQSQVVVVPATKSQVVPGLPSRPTQINCPHCRQNVVTRVNFDTTLGTWLVVGGTCIAGCFCGCCLIPLCMDSCKDAVHSCPSCNNYVGTKYFIRM